MSEDVNLRVVAPSLVTRISVTCALSVTAGRQETQVNCPPVSPGYCEPWVHTGHDTEATV